MRRHAYATAIFCLVVGASLGVLLLSGARWTLPRGGSGTNQYVQAGHPFVEVDPMGGASLVCISNQSGRVLPPYLDAGVPTPAPALASNPPSVGGAL